MSEEFWHELLEEHFPEIMKWAEEKWMSMKPEEVEEFLHGDPIKRLPKKLKDNLKDRRAFKEAYRNGLISYERGKWYSHFENASHFSYFCARCFCDDYLERGVLRKGGSNFPASPLQKTFRVGNMKDSRKKLLETQISDKYQYIDTLFNECCNGGKKGGKGGRKF